MTEKTLYYRGAYRGVPFEIHHDHITPWDLVDPKRADKNNGVLMCHSSEGDNEWGHVIYGDAQENLVDSTLAEIRSAKLPQIMRSMRGNLGTKAWNKIVAEEGSPEAAVDSLITQMGDSSPRQWAAIFDLAGVPYKFADISMSYDEQYQILYFFENGRKFKVADHDNFKELFPRVKNWVQGCIYSAHTPLEECYSFCDEANPRKNENCQIMDYIKEQIDALRDKTTGDYVVEAEYVTSASSATPTNAWKFDTSRLIKFNVDTKEDAKRLAGFYGGHALPIARAAQSPER